MEFKEIPKELFKETEKQIREELTEKGIDINKQKTVLFVGKINNKDGSLSLKTSKENSTDSRK